MTIGSESEDIQRDKLKEAINQTFEQALSPDKQAFLEKLEWVKANIHTIHAGIIAVDDLGGETMHWQKTGGDITNLGLIEWVRLEINEKLRREVE